MTASVAEAEAESTRTESGWSDLPDLGSARPRVALWLVAGADARVGAGHAMRMLTLAEAWIRADTGPVRLCGRIEIPFVAARASRIGVDTVPTPPAPGEAEGGIVVVDTYDANARAALGRHHADGIRVLVDDLGGPVDGGYAAVWNPNPYGSREMYPGFGGRMITGPTCVPIRTGLPAWSGASDPRVGVLLGGGQPPTSLRMAVETLVDSVGRGNLVLAGDWLQAEVHHAPSEQPWTDLARCGRLLLAAGTSAWEAAAVGIPVALVQTAENQRLVAAWAAAAATPVVNGLEDEATLAPTLERALDAAIPLPPLTPGTPAVVREIRSLVA